MKGGSLRVDAVPASDSARDAEIGDFFERCPTSFAQQNPAWRDVIAQIDRDEPWYLLCRRGDELVGALPAYRFEAKLGAILTSVPQAGPLGGIACAPDIDAKPVYEALLDAFQRHAESQGCALATVISNPFWPDDELYRSFFEPDYELENVLQAIDLRSDAADSWVSGSSNLKRNLRKAESGVLCIDDRQSRANLEEWYEIHAARHTQIGATPLPKSLFTGALEHMVPAEKGHFVFVRLADGGVMVGGALYIHHGRVLDALMPSVSGEHARLGTAFLLGAHSIRRARERGFHFYNWQPSPPDSGVYRFKRQWGSGDFPYSYFTRVTGDAAAFLAASAEEIAADYRWHYVLPFDQIGDAASSSGRRSSRKAAWTALTGESG